MRLRGLALAGLVLLTGTAFAGRNHWTTTGPPGGAQMIVADPLTASIVYALGGDLFRSIDGGQTWAGMNLYLAFPYSAAIAPNDPSVLYVGSLEGRVKKSLDGGKTWDEVDSGLPTVAILAIAVDPANAATAYAGTNGSGIFKTTDGGDSWTSISTTLPIQSEVTSVAIDPKDSSILYLSASSYAVGAAPDGVFKSTDAGETWTREPGGRPSGTALAVDPFDSDVIYEVAGGDGLWKSVDEGSTWQQMNSGLPASFDAVSLALDPRNRNTLYLGLFGDSNGDQVFKSTDGGTNWSQAFSGNAAFSPVTVAVNADGSVALIGDSKRVSRSTDAGASWETSTAGLFGGSFSVAVDSRGNAYSGGAASFFSTSGGRRAWAELEISGLSAAPAQSIAIDPQNSDTLYVGIAGPGIYKTIDAGRTWTWADQIFRGDVFAIAIDPQDSKNVYAANELLGEHSLIDWVSSSTDGGQTWTFPDGTAFGIDCLAIDRGRSWRLYAGGYDVYRSTDFGVHWTALETGIPGSRISAVVLDPHDSSIIYAALKSANALQFGVLKTEDDGGHWVLENRGLPKDVSLSSLAIDPGHPNILYAGSFDQGVFRSVDAGVTWDRMNSGLSNPTIYALAMDPSGARLFAGTAAGVFEISPVSIMAVPPSSFPALVSGRDASRPLER